jgi:hypothetical protein
MRDWLRTARQPTVVRRAAKVAMVVGTILILINHGDALWRGDIDLTRGVKMLTTVFVPYMVSTYSVVDAIRNANRAAEAKERDAGQS